jgi:hypothetical protein
MTTKSQRFRAASLLERSIKDAEGDHASQSKPLVKPHTQGQRASRTARVTYDPSGARRAVVSWAQASRVRGKP